MTNFYQVFKNEPICQYAESYCEYDGDVEVVCGKCTVQMRCCERCQLYLLQVQTRLLCMGGTAMTKHKKCYGKCDRCVWKNNGGCSEWRRISGGEARLQHNAEKSFVECASCHARSDYYLISYRSRQTVL